MWLLPTIFLGSNHVEEVQKGRMMDKAVVFGAGSVGRGFVGQLFSEAGFLVTFLDVSTDLVNKLAEEGSYIHVTVSSSGTTTTTVGPVTAIDAADGQAAVAAIVDADIAATAVGMRALPAVAATLAEALEKRVAEGRPPLNVLLCENLHGAANLMRNLISESLPALTPTVLSKHLALLETSVGRMIPSPEPEVLEQNPTVIFAEPFKQLPYDAKMALGPKIQVPGLVSDLETDFAFYGDRKLYIHNLGHALTAYLGEIDNIDLIAEAIRNVTIRYLVRSAMIESALALSTAYEQPLGALIDHVDELIHRFGNFALKDDVRRVGRDPIRKMAANDRFIGSFMSAVQQRLPSKHLSLAVAAGADALRRHESWGKSRVQEHMSREIPLDALTGNERNLLLEQVEGFRSGEGLGWQVDLISETYGVVPHDAETGQA